LFIDVTIPVHHVDSRNTNIREFKSSIIDSVHAEFNTHIVDSNSRKSVKVSVTDRNHESVYTFVLSINNSLSENKSMVSMLESVGNPVLLSESGRSVYNKLLGSFVISDSSLHLYSVVTISKLSKAEATKGTEVINLIKVVLVSLSRKSISRSSEKVELNSEFDGSRVINHSQELMSCKDIMRVVSKVTDRDHLVLLDLLYLLHRVISDSLPVGEVISRYKYGVL
jgi:hypothetical protein